MTQKPKRGMVFGVFDGLHEGHKHFLRDAKSRSEELVVIVPPDEAVKELKGHTPEETLRERMGNVRNSDSDLKVFPGDVVQGTWHIVKKHSPDHIFLGYDQQPLADALSGIGVPYTFLNPYEPDVFKSGLLREEAGEG